jgi:phenylalanyl-tRNA synthetase beta chain
MRIPLGWLSELVELKEPTTPAAVMQELVKLGLEEEASHGADISGPVVVGQVLDFVDEPQSNGKTIRWCSVRVAPEGSKPADGGESVRGIVCGAHNFAKDDFVVVSLPGSVLPGGFEITARKTYGHVSDGMIASARELGLGEDHSGILILGELGVTAEVGADAIELLGLSESAAEVSVTPDRGYCLSMRGIAREYALATGQQFSDPAVAVKPQLGSGFPLSVDSKVADPRIDPGCTRFELLEVSNLDAAAPSPNWMKTRLRLAGMRPISLLVDVTNYVMLELGQPLHAYDADKLKGGISVRRAKAGEKLVTLDEKERQLNSEDLVIADEAGAIGMAGVMGGLRTEVDGSTKRVLLEAANFHPISIARSARRHRLPSEASRRFERGVDPEIASAAATRAANLLVELSGGKITGGGASYQTEVSRPALRVTVQQISQRVGVEYSSAQVRAALEGIGCELSGAGGASASDSFEVTPPSWRPDLRIPEDFAEEVARVQGYDQIPSVLPVAPPGRGLSREQQLRRRLLTALTDAGFTEVMNYPFLSPAENAIFGEAKAVRLQNPLQGDQPELRTSLLPGLLTAAERNLGRGNESVALLEFGSVFLAREGKQKPPVPSSIERPSDADLAALEASLPQQPQHLALLVSGNWLPAGFQRGEQPAGYAQLISALELIAGTFKVEFRLEAVEAGAGQSASDSMHPGRVATVSFAGIPAGFVGELHPDTIARFHLQPRSAVLEIDFAALAAAAAKVGSARPISAQPAATQDISLVVPEATAAAELAAAAREAAGEWFEDLRIADVYQGDNLALGTKSVTLHLTFRHLERTLTQAEVSESREAIVALVAKRFGGSLRA